MNSITMNASYIVSNISIKLKRNDTQVVVLKFNNSQNIYLFTNTVVVLYDKIVRLKTRLLISRVFIRDILNPLSSKFGQKK